MELLRHLQHHMIAVVAPLRDLPILQLLGQVEGRLGVQRRSVLAAEPRGAMALLARSGIQPRGRRGDGFFGGRRQRLRRQRGIVVGHLHAFVAVEKARRVAHHGVRTQACCVVFHLLLQIARRQAGQARRVEAIALATRAVAGHAGIARATFAAAHRDALSVGTPAVVAAAHAIGASRRQHGRAQGQPQAAEVRRPVCVQRWA